MGRGPAEEREPPGTVLDNDRDARSKVKVYPREGGGYDVYSEDGGAYYGAMPEDVLRELYGPPGD